MVEFWDSSDVRVRGSSSSRDSNGDYDLIIDSRQSDYCQGDKCGDGFHLVCSACNDVTFENISIYGRRRADGSPLGNDGIDIQSSQNTVVRNCTVDTADDGLVTASSDGSGEESINNLFENCITSSDTSPIKFGSGSMYNFTNITYRDITIKDSSVGAIGISNIDGAIMSDINFENITVESDVSEFFRCGAGTGSNCNLYECIGQRDSSSPIGAIRDVTFKNIKTSHYGGGISCGEESINSMEKVEFENITCSNPVDFRDICGLSFGSSADANCANLGSNVTDVRYDGGAPECQGVSSPPPSSSDFRFIAWADNQAGNQGDKQGDLNNLSQLSDQANDIGFDFTLFSGDLEDSGFTDSGMDDWREAIDGVFAGGSLANGTADKTFAARGNHDKQNSSGWQNYFNFQSISGNVGAANFSSYQNNQVYSFDYGNSHFVGLDMFRPDSDQPLTLTQGQIDWLDTDLSKAESRGLTHAFLYFHEAIYCVGRYCPNSCTSQVCDLDPILDNSDPASKSLIEVINDHPIVSATFSGHEHINTVTYLDNSRIPTLSNDYYQFVVSPAGQFTRSCNRPDRYEWCGSMKSFAAVDVSGAEVTVNFYKMNDNSSQKSITFNNSGGGSGPFCGDGTCDSGEDNQNCSADCPANQPSNASCDSNFNCDSGVNIKDFGILLSHWGRDAGDPQINGYQHSNCSNSTSLDLDQSGIIDSGDLSILLGEWGGGSC